MANPVSVNNFQVKSLGSTDEVRMQDGTEKTIAAGESYTIPPGHDAWVVGDQAFVGIEVISTDVYAKP